MNTLRAKFSPEERVRLARSQSYREFLHSYFEATKLAYAEVARRGGFSSRSYPRDVTEGRRRLTARSLPSLVRGLRLDPDMARVFQLLYFSQYPDEHPESLPRDSIFARLEKERAKTARHASRVPARRKEKLPKLTLDRGRGQEVLAPGLVDLVAALGDSDEGATIEMIQKRTGTRRSLLAIQLESLIALGGVRYMGASRRYVATAEHIDWTGSGAADLARLACESAISRMSRVAGEHFGSAETMFLDSAFAISKDDLPRLKTELRELLLSFVDRSIESASSTEAVVHLTAGMFESRLAPPE